MSQEIFIYDWSYDTNENDRLQIHIFGLNEKNETTLLNITDFYPYIYIELPNITWDSYSKKVLANQLSERFKQCPPKRMKFVYRKRLYYVHKDENMNDIQFPYIICYFDNEKACKMAKYSLNRKIKMMINGERYELSLKVHEDNATPILQLVCQQNIQMSGWCSFSGVKKTTKISSCDHEYNILSSSLSPIQKDTIPKPMILSYDIECYSDNPNTMPNAKRISDCVFQISCVFWRKDEEKHAYLLTLGNVDQLDNGQVLCYKNEANLLQAFAKLIHKYNPQLITGYNIFGFDIPYMVKRADLKNVAPSFHCTGMLQDKFCEQVDVQWSSSAYSNQSFHFVDMDGRIQIDLLSFVKREFKLPNYKLDTVAFENLGTTKDPVTAKDIFTSYKQGVLEETKEGLELLKTVGHYCIKDSLLVAELFDKFDIWINITEMSGVCNVPSSWLYTKGQQVKVFSQIYKFCYDNKIVVERNAYTAQKNEKFTGATVMEPKPGLYDYVIPFDFCFSGDTLISMSNGVSKRIVDMKNDMIISTCKNNGIISSKMVNGLQNKGVRKTVKVMFQDGNELICTPEHKIMDENGEWVKAKDLTGKYVLSGLKGTEDVKCEKELNWSLETNGYIFSFENDLEREKTLAFSRMLGYVLADGCIYISSKYNRQCAEAYFGTMIDAENFMNDIELICGKRVTIRHRVPPKNSDRSVKGSTCCISIPVMISKMIHSLDNIVVGKRATQEMKLPSFVLNDECPLSIVREFLGGLYGGDGCAPHVNHSNDKHCLMSFKWTTIENYTNNMENVFNQLQKLHVKLGINAFLSNRKKINHQLHQMKPKDYKENKRYDYILSIPKDETSLFLKYIGFRYCVHKMYRLVITSSYEDLLKNTRKQYDTICHQTKQLYDMQIAKTYQECLDIVVSQFREPILNECSIPNVMELRSTLQRNKDYPTKPNKKRMSYKQNFPSFSHYIEDLKVKHWFEKGAYVLGQLETSLPTYRQKVIHVVEHEDLPVYDIEVEKTHNFFAEGICVSNCSLYPSVIIAYNIDYSTFVNDNRIPDEMCNVLEWEEHKHCEHDKIYIPDKNVCEKYRFRFLKEPKGVLPTIIQNLLNARKNTRKQIGELKKENKEEDKLMINILDKRQLSYKISANSMYGTLGVERGYLPFMPAAVCVTAMGRMNIRKARKHLEERYNAEAIYGDSVIGDTPILLRDKEHNIFIQTIDSLGDEWKEYEEFKSEDSNRREKLQSRVDLECWTNGGWSPIKRVIKHKTCKKIYRVNTHCGVVDVTEDHSLLNENCEKIKAEDCVVGETRLLTGYYNMEDNIPQHLNNINNHIGQQNGIEEKKAFIFGMFFGDGSCGYYDCKSGKKYSWAINNTNKELLFLCQKYLTEIYGSITQFKILETMRSSGVYKLVPYGNIKYMVSRFRPIFYDCRKYKIIPQEISNNNYNIMYNFFVGYYAADGYKCTNSIVKNIKFANKGKIGSAQLYNLVVSLGYKCSINIRSDKPDIYTLSCSIKLRKQENIVKKIELIHDNYTDFVYDLETEDGTFQAGVGNLIIKNTDSVYIRLPHIPPEKLWETAERMEKEMIEEKIFPPALILEFEKAIYKPFLTLSKKRYLYKNFNRDGTFGTKLGTKGVLLSRRDNCEFARELYKQVIEMVFSDYDKNDVLNYIVEYLNQCCRGELTQENFILTKSLKDKTDYKIKKLSDDESKKNARLKKLNCSEEEYHEGVRALPAHVQLAQRMRQRGIRVDAGERIEYVITDMGGLSAPIFDKIEDPEYQSQFSDIIKIEYLSYIKTVTNQIDEILGTVWKLKDFFKQQYKLREKKAKIGQEIKFLYNTKLLFLENGETSEAQKDIMAKKCKKLFGKWKRK